MLTSLPSKRRRGEKIKIREFACMCVPETEIAETEIEMQTNSIAVVITFSLRGE